MSFDSIVRRIDPERSISFAHIARIESRYGIVFPDSLRAFFLKYNGAVLKAGVERGGGGIHEVTPIKWDSYGEGWGGNVTDLMEQYRELGLIGSFLKPTFVPFLIDQFGNDYVCDTAAKEGTVYIAFLNLGPDNRAELVCDSLDEFLDTIVEERP